MFAFGFIGPLAVAASALAAPPPQVVVTGAWARATLPHQDTGVVYMILRSATPNLLAGVSSQEAGMAMLHKDTQEGGMEGMADVDSVTLPANQPVVFAPHGMHIMLMDLKHPLTAGSVIGVDLTFQKAGTVHAQVKVEKITATGPQG